MPASRSRARRWLWIATIALIVLHQDWWNWSRVEPRFFGFLPIGLGYHALFAIACAVLMYCFVRFLWPRELEYLQQNSQEPPRNKQ